MTIFGINFNNFGSRKLRFDSQNRGLAFSSSNKPDETERILNKFDLSRNHVKYALPSDPTQYDENLKDDAPTIKYGIPSDNFNPYFNINEKKPNNDGKIMKYAIPHKF